MKLILTLSLAAVALAQTAYNRETINEAAVHARELAQYRGYGIGTLMSLYPEGDGDLAGLPIGLQEYYTMDSNGDVIFLAMPIAKVFSNAMAPHRPNMTFTISDLAGLGTGDLAAGRYRIALFGSLEAVPESEVKDVAAAYVREHPDARGWVPPGGPHSSYYARLRIHKVFAFDGFGNVAYIGWLPLEMWKDAGKLMRSKSEVLSDWPVPEQPEQELAASLFAERVREGEGMEAFKMQERRMIAL